MLNMSDFQTELIATKKHINNLYTILLNEDISEINKEYLVLMLRQFQEVEKTLTIK